VPDRSFSQVGTCEHCDAHSTKDRCKLNQKPILFSGAENKQKTEGASFLRAALPLTVASATRRVMAAVVERYHAAILTDAVLKVYLRIWHTEIELFRIDDCTPISAPEVPKFLRTLELPHHVVLDFVA
jgi:hypothetical protein